MVSDSSGKEIKQGSGVVVSADGKVVTNFHVIDGAGSAVIKFPNGAFYLVEGVLAADKQKDVAVLKASGTDFPFIQLGDSDKVQIGEEVVSIGSPLSLEATVSSGIISSIRDLKEENARLFQTTAPISHGSSGGALLNMRGEVIGITTAQMTGGQNLNFAVPINIAKPLLTANSAKKFGETAGKEDTANPSDMPDLWTSMITGHDYKIRMDSNHLYLEMSFPAAFQKFVDQGAFARCHLEREGSKWGGTCVSYLPFQWFSKWNGNHINWCRLRAKEEITLLTPSRIEGDFEAYDPKDFDASKCTVKKTTMNHFVWIPKK